MRRILPLLTVLGSVPLASAATLVQSGQLLDGADAPVSGTVGLQFRLFDVPAGGAPLWDSGVSPCSVAVQHGRYSVTLGAGCGADLPAAALPTQGLRYLELAVNGVLLAPRQVLAAVPAASRAGDADTLGGVPSSGFARLAADGKVPLAILPTGAGGVVVLDAQGRLPVSSIPMLDTSYVSLRPSGGATPQMGNLSLSGQVSAGSGAFTSLDVATATVGSLSATGSISGSTAQFSTVGATSIDAGSVTASTLSVNGPLQLGATSSACSAATAGSLRWSAAAGQAQVCDGTGWKAVGGAVPALLRWTSATLDLGNVAGVATQTVTLQNAGSQTSSAIALRAAAPLSVVSHTCGGGLASGATCTVTVRLVSNVDGAFDGALIASAIDGGSATLPVSAQVDGWTGSGTDGALTVSGTFNLSAQKGGVSRAGTFADGIAYAVSSVSGTAVTLSDTANGFASGDRALLWLAQATGDTTDVGNYDLVSILSVSGTTITLASAIDGARYDQGSARKWVLQRVPQYTDVTIPSGATLTTSAWDGLSAAPSGSAGRQTGLIAFLATGTVSVTGRIDSSERGYRGGIHTPDNLSYGYTGESFGGGNTTKATGLGTVNGGGGSGGLGGNSCCHGIGGGGGGYATAGGIGTQDGEMRTWITSPAPATPGGGTYGEAILGRLYPGSGGGGGGTHSGSSGTCDANDAECNRGGAGGGVVWIRASRLSVPSGGVVAANGGSGFPIPGTAGCETRRTINTQDGSGGSGSGGSIWLRVREYITAPGSIEAKGAPAGCLTGWPASNTNMQRGGAGGDGRIRLIAPSISASTATPTPSTANE